MSGVFISYQRGDEAQARRITLALRALGVDVWWDQDMLSVDWQTELERRGNELAAVAVLWSPAAAASDPVRDEARLGLKSKKLVNLLSGLAEPPYPFDRVNGIPLDGWEGVAPHSNWRRFVASLDEKLAAHGSMAAGALKARLAAQEDEFRKREREIVTAEAAVAAAGRTLARENGALAGLREKLAEAEAQIDGLRKIKASPAVLATARSEHEAASAQLCTAEADVARAGADVEEADCKLDATKRALTQWIAEQGGTGSEGVAGLSAPDVPVSTPEPVPNPVPVPVPEPVPEPPKPKRPPAALPLAPWYRRKVTMSDLFVIRTLPMAIAFTSLVVIAIFTVVLMSRRSVPVTVDTAAANAATVVAEAGNSAMAASNEPVVSEITLLELMTADVWALNGDCSTYMKFARESGGVRRTVHVPGIEDSSSLDRIVDDGVAAFKSNVEEYRTAPGAAGRTEVLSVKPLDGSKPYEITPCLTVG